MRNSLIAKVIVFLLLNPLTTTSAFSKNIVNEFLSNQLETTLNEKKYHLLKDLFLQKSFKQFDKHYQDFKNKYKDAKWSIKTISHEKNNIFLDIKITSTREIGEELYNLKSKQVVEVKTFRDKIKSFEILNEESILNSQQSPLIVRIISPDNVLTGERYEMNLIIERPLDNSFTASGMIILKGNNNKLTNDFFGIKPNQSGGLFKYITAPLDPGYQTISAIITHPKGIYLITKKIKVDL